MIADSAIVATSGNRSVGLSVFFVLCLGGFTTGCTSEPPESIAFADEAPVMTEPSTAGFSNDERELISFHADWLCELQRRTFANLDESESAFVAALEDAGLTRSAYDQFLTNVLSTQSGRNAVFYQHQQDCRAK